MIPNIKSIPFSKLTILAVFSMLVGSGSLGYLFANQDKAQVLETYYQGAGKGNYQNSNELEGDVSENQNLGKKDCLIGTLKSKHNSSPLSNGDKRFMCWDGTLYFCGETNKWENKGVVKVENGDLRGDFECGNKWEFKNRNQGEMNNEVEDMDMESEEDNRGYMWNEENSNSAGETFKGAGKVVVPPNFR